MASVTGSQLAFFAQGNTTGSNINLVLTPDGTGTLTPDPTKFNIEVFTTSSVAIEAAGFQASARIDGAVTVSGNQVVAGSPGATEQLLDGSFQLVDQSAGGHETIQIIGSAGSNDTVVGAPGDTIVGSAISGVVQTIFGGTSDSISGGADTTNVVAAAFDTVAGNAGALTVFGATSGHLSITGGAGGLKAFDLGQKNVVTGGSGPVFIDDSYAGGGSSTLTGGTGIANFLKGGNGDLLIGGNVGLTGQTIMDGHVGTNETIIGGFGAGTFITGGVGSHIAAGNGVQVFIDGSLGSQTIQGSTTNNILGSSLTDVYFTGANDSIVGASGSLAVAGSNASGLTIQGGSGGLNAVNIGTGSSVVGGSGGTNLINASFAGNGSSTLVGGGAATTIVAGVGDSIIGGAGNLEVRIRDDLSGAADTINLSGEVDTIRDVNFTGSTVGGSTASAQVHFFNASVDKIASNTSVDNTGKFLGTSGSDGSGGTLLTFLDGSTLDIVGVGPGTKLTFIQ